MSTKSTKSLLNFRDMGIMAGKVTHWWQVFGPSVYLGWVDFYPHWRRFVFHPNNTTLYDAECLREISNFLENQTAARRTERLIERSKAAIP